MQRMGMVIRIKPEEIAAYKDLHANVWPQVLERLKKSNISNYSIFLREPENLMFGYWEYTGNNFKVDMQAIAEDKTTQDWWAICGPKQMPLESRAEGEWWADMELIFLLE